MRRPATDARLTMAPLPCFSMIGSTYLQARKAVLRLWLICVSQTSSLMVAGVAGAEGVFEVVSDLRVPAPSAHGRRIARRRAADVVDEDIDAAELLHAI